MIYYVQIIQTLSCPKTSQVGFPADGVLTVLNLGFIILI